MPRLVVAAVMLAAVCGSASAQEGHHDHHAPAKSGALTEAGQAAFAAVSEAVAMLSADPETDWSSVNIDVMRDHLVDMDNVMMRASVTKEDIAGGVRYVVTGEGEIAASIRRMAPAHARMVDGQGGMAVSAQLIERGAVVTATGAGENAADRIRGLGYFGLLTLGAHHQPHHLMLAKGASPH